MKRNVSCLAICVVLTMCAVVHAQSSSDKLQVRFPGKSWSVVVTSPGFVTETNGTQSNGRQYLFATNKKTGMNVSVSLERIEGGADASTCPQYLQKRVTSLSELGLRDVRYFSVGDMAAAQYLVPEAQGQKIRQMHLVACTAQEDIYIDVHLSKVQFKGEDEQLFTDLIRRVSISGVPPTGMSNPEKVKELVASGSRYFLDEQYREAIIAYQQALELEKKQRTLDKNMWRVLVDNLGMAYGISGDLKSAEATLQYGLTEDPNYPMFYYNMACVWAERNELDKAVQYLKAAFSNKSNGIPGEKMPNPRYDDSFQRFLENEKFTAFLESVGQ